MRDRLVIALLLITIVASSTLVWSITHNIAQSKYDLGFATGYSRGNCDGYHKGYTAGYTDGNKTGYSNGYLTNSDPVNTGADLIQFNASEIQNFQYIKNLLNITNTVLISLETTELYNGSQCATQQARSGILIKSRWNTCVSGAGKGLMVSGKRL